MTITWDQPSKQKKIYARFDGDGILIDDIQLEQGDLTPYASPQVEAGFLFEENNVFFAHRSAAIRKSVRHFQ